MFSIFPPWDQRARGMQRWKAGRRYNVTIVLSVPRTFAFTNSNQGMYINNSGSVTIPSVLPLQSVCGQICLIAGEGRGVVLQDIKYANFPVIGILGGRGSLLQGPEREIAARGEIVLGVNPDAMGRVSPDAFARRMEDEGLAYDVQQILYDPELSTQASNLEALFSDWTERTWQCPACHTLLAAGFIVCFRCKLSLIHI